MQFADAYVGLHTCNTQPLVEAHGSARSSMGAQDNLAAAVAAVLSISQSHMVRDPGFGVILRTYFTRIGEVQHPRVMASKRR